jgi:protoheme IX farnesyltransferase
VAERVTAAGTRRRSAGRRVQEVKVIRADAPPRAQASSTVDTTEPAQGTPTTLRAAVSAFYELTKPGITRMVVMTTAAGFFLATTGAFPFVAFLHTLFGTALSAAGSLALNQYAEREVDRSMGRTCGRPLPSGRMAPATAASFGLLLSAVGLLYLTLFVNVLTMLLVATSIVTYVVVYTPLKRFSWTATPVGAIPGALPILAGWTAARGSIGSGGLALFAVLFLWQMPHFYALAWMYRDDYRRAGFRLLSVDDTNGDRTVRQILGFTIAMVLASALPTLVGLSGIVYLVGALALGIAFYVVAHRFARERNHRNALRVFLGSVTYLPALLVLLVVDRLFF